MSFTPEKLHGYLSTVIKAKIMTAVMIWGPPGIGKSSIVAEVAQASDLSFIDLRLSQLAPTDLRGLPVPEDGTARWYPPEFLPRKGKGILFLDELNMALPAIQGIAQQLILDRKVGAYTLPEGWFIWAAGNRKEDRASVFDMPAPLANRFLHVEVVPDFDSFKKYALVAGVHEHILAFLSFRTALLHKQDNLRPAWPSPRSWMMANGLHKAGVDIESAVGDPTAGEFNAFLKVYESITFVDRILAGGGGAYGFPEEPSIKYALTTGLALRPSSTQEAVNAFRWMVDKAPAEWTTLMVITLAGHMRATGQFALFAAAFTKEPKIMEFFNERQRIESGV